MIRERRAPWFFPSIVAVAIVACAPASSSQDSGSGGSTGTAGASGAAGSSQDGTDPSTGNGGADGGAVTPPPDPSTCGARTTMRGLTQRKVTVAGLARTYLVYLPPTLDPKSAAPFVYVFHGYTMSGQQMHDLTSYAALADREGVGVVFPDGEGGADSLDKPWNIENPGQTVCGEGQSVDATGDDFQFMDVIKADVTQDQCLDQAHVFATGFSMGGYFTHHVACYRNDIRAGAPHSGGTIADLASCTTAHVPMIIFHGDADSVISAGCDDPHAAAEQGFSASATLWAKKNGCGTTSTAIPTDGAGGGKGQCYLYDGCPADGQVEVCAFAGMDHCWAGGSTSGTGGSSACPTYADATELQWAFFKKYAW